MKKVIITLLLCFTSMSFATQAVLLVSLGMPDNTLKAYLRQGKQYHIPIVIRGLYSKKQDLESAMTIGNFKETIGRIYQLTHEDNIGGLFIDPLPFSAFEVKVVPALVIYDDNLRCLSKAASPQNTVCEKTHFDVIFGNLPLAKLLEIIANRSSSASRAHFAKMMLANYSRQEA